MLCRICDAIKHPVIYVCYYWVAAGDRLSGRAQSPNWRRDEVNGGLWVSKAAAIATHYAVLEFIAPDPTPWRRPRGSLEMARSEVAASIETVAASIETGMALRPDYDEWFAAQRDRVRLLRARWPDTATALAALVENNRRIQDLYYRRR